MRQIVLDTETTGINPAQGHRIIEIGCVELVDRKLTGNHYHQYINPEREVEQGAIDVHGITNEFLEDKPFFTAFSRDFLEFIKGAQLVIHNAPFDVGFIEHEFRINGEPEFSLAAHCTVLDTLELARDMHPGQKNSLDALCRRYDIDNSQRELHGALLDSEILADVYLRMTGGQMAMNLGSDSAAPGVANPATAIRRVSSDRRKVRVISATDDELLIHKEKLDAIQVAGCEPMWLKLKSEL